MSIWEWISFSNLPLLPFRMGSRTASLRLNGSHLGANLCGPLRGNMRPQMYLHASRTARSSRLPLDSADDFPPATRTTIGVARALRRLVALAMALLLLPLGQAELFAQQAPPPGQGSSQNDPYNGQYAPDQQSGDSQQPYTQQPYPDSGQVYPQQNDGQAQPPAQPLNAEQLEQLVAPIALYPDTLVAQVLAASTYPAQVVEADRWRQAQGYASPDQIAAGADAQTWDPSLKALMAFPQVLAEMDRNLQWTTDLGNAYYNQPQDVLEAVQVMRRRAQAAGNLQSTPQEAVSYDQGNIELAPVNPQIVYVPAYNPWSVYGQPVSPYPGFSLLGALGSFFGSSPISYGLGIAMTAFSHTPWGWLAWGLNWLSQSVLFQHANYYSHSTTVADWGFPHGGLRAFPERGTIARLPNSFNRTPGSYGRPSFGYNVTPRRGFVPRPPASYGRPGGGYNATLGRGFIPRPPDRYGRPASGYNVTPRRGFVPRPPDTYAGNRPGEDSSRGYQTPRVNYARPPLQAYNHTQPAVTRPQQYGRPGYGSSLYNRPGEGYGRSGTVYGSARRSYRAPTAAFQRAYFGPRSSGTLVGTGFAKSSGKPAHSGGFHLFGGGHASENFHGGGHAPKSFSGGKNFSRGHSGGGHSGGHGSGRHHH